MPIGNHVRQWVPLSGGSCDLRIGAGVIDELGSILKGSVGRPHACALVTDEGVGEMLLERVRRQLTDAGFVVRALGLGGRCLPQSLEATAELARGLGRERVTSDDLIVAVGESGLLSAVAYVAGAWCGGTPLALVPCSAAAAIEAAATPRGLEVGGVPELLATRACARYAICDPNELSADPAARRLAHALMVATAFCDSERAFAALWDRAPQLAAGEVEATCAQLAASANSRGRIASSTAASTRQAIGYGSGFARALMALVPDVDAGIALAEGMRFCARLAAGAGSCSVDDVLAQDELLETLSVGSASCDVDADELVRTLKEERFRRTNRFLLELPRSIGRVRPATVDEALLAEHAAAFCAARRGGDA